MSTSINWDAINEALAGNITVESFVKDESLEERAQATSEKLMRFKQIQAEKLALHKADEASWVGRMGLDKDGVVGGAVNLLLANPLQMTGTMLGQVNSAAQKGANSTINAVIPVEVKQARRAQIEGTATPEQEQLLTQPALPEENFTRPGDKRLY